MAVLLHLLPSSSDPWKSTLPPSLPTPIHWNAGQLRSLNYPALSTSVLDQVRSWSSLHALLSPHLPSLSSASFTHNSELARSRAFSSPSRSGFNPVPFATSLALSALYLLLDLGTPEQAANGAAVVLCGVVLKDFVLPKLQGSVTYTISPGNDLPNHSAAPTADVSFSYFQSSHTLTALSDVPDGQPVTISYGPRSNDQLLQYYGFVLPDNPDDVFVLPPLGEWDLDALKAACGGREVGSGGRMEALDRVGLLESPCVLTREGIDEAVVQALRALCSSDEDWSRLESVGNFAAKVSAENEDLANKCVAAIIEQEAARFGTVKEENAAAREARKMGDDVGEMCATFRREKRKVLDAAMEVHGGK